MAELTTINESNEMGFDSLVVGKAPTKGIKVDKDTPTFPWDDVIGQIVVKGSGGTDPSWATWKGNINKYKFGVNDQIDLSFHLPHEYALGTDVFLHVHWTHDSATISTGAPTFTYECSYAKGHNQEAFGANVTGTISENASLTQYQHMVTEVQLSAASPSAAQLDTDDLEPDGIIECNISLTANTMDGSALPFIHHVDIHFQTTSIGTKNKTPNFYT